MKLLKILIPAVVPLLLLCSCGPRELGRLGFDRVDSFRAEELRFGSAEGVATLSLYNGNKKSVTFGSGRIEVRLNGRAVGIVTLLRPVAVPPGYCRTEVPVRIRFPQDGLKSVAELVLPEGGSRARKPDLRIAGSLGFDRGNRIQTVRFDRKVSGKTLKHIGEQFIHSFGFRL